MTADLPVNSKKTRREAARCDQWCAESVWHSRFAWAPVRLNCGSMAWLIPVERRLTERFRDSYNFWTSGGADYEFRSATSALKIAM